VPTGNEISTYPTVLTSCFGCKTMQTHLFVITSRYPCLSCIDLYAETDLSLNTISDIRKWGFILGKWPWLLWLLVPGEEGRRSLY